MGRPGERFAPHGTGCPASRAGNERPSRKSRSPGRTRSPDKTPGPGPGPIVSGRNRGRSGRFAHLEPPNTGRIGKPLGMPIGTVRGPRTGRGPGLLQHLPLSAQGPDLPGNPAAAPGRLQRLPGRLLPQRPGYTREVRVPKSDQPKKRMAGLKSRLLLPTSGQHLCARWRRYGPTFWR